MAKLFPTDKNELISHLEEILKGIPLKNERMRAECTQVIKQLKEQTPTYPTEKKVAKKENRELLVGGETNEALYERYEVPSELQCTDNKNQKRSR